MADGVTYRKQDPDYDEVIATPESFRRQDEEKSNRDSSIKKIRSILERHFDGEIHAKEEEVLNIERKISQTRNMLDRLRSYLLANYYGNGKMIRGRQIEEKKREKRKDDMKSSKRHCSEKLSGSEDVTAENSNRFGGRSVHEGNDSKPLKEENCQSKTELIENDLMSANRFYAKKIIIVGNISKFIPLEKRDKNDQATHKWMVYVRGPPGEPDVSSFVQRVWFILHPSYMPNDIIEVGRPPFTVTRRGWGEFPVRIQLGFHDPRNKPVDIIHNLKLDKTYTGLQTLGAETHVAIELQRHTVKEQFGRVTVSKATISQPNESGKRSSDCASMKLVAEPKSVQDVMEKFDTGWEKFSIKLPEELLTFQDVLIPRKVMELRKDILGDGAEGKISSGASSITSEVSAPQSWSNSPVSSPVPVSVKEDVYRFDYFVEEALVKNVTMFPLVSANRDITKNHYCATTDQQYSSWSFSKRRAAEWQRALDMKQFFIKNDIAYDLTTKDVMLWCRKHGFTPSESKTLVVQVKDLDYCPKCGKCFPDSALGNKSGKGSETDVKWCGDCLSDLTIKSTSTLSSFDEFLRDVYMQESKLSNLPDFNNPSPDSTDSVVDVVGSEGAEKDKESENLIDITKLPPISESSLTDWIFEVAAQIEVDLKSVAVNGRKVPILQQLLLQTIRSFVRDILTESYAHSKSFKANLEPAVITPLHVLNALNSIPQMDFLTNKYFGIQEEDGKI